MLETEESISKIDSHRISQEASELGDRVVKWVPGNSKYVGKHNWLASIIVVYIFRTQEQFLRVRFCNILGYILLNSLTNNHK